MNLSEKASVVFKINSDVQYAHEDVDLWHAPSECHDLVQQHADKKMFSALREMNMSARELYDEIEARTSEKFAYFFFCFLLDYDVESICERRCQS